jgi:hypothetical protein
MRRSVNDNFYADQNPKPGAKTKAILGSKKRGDSVAVAPAKQWR